MKQPWDQVKLTIQFWDGDKPQVGDELLTRTGRRYQILSFVGKRLTCLVLPKDEPIKGRVFYWEWGRRERRKK